MDNGKYGDCYQNSIIAEGDTFIFHFPLSIFHLPGGPPNDNLQILQIRKGNIILQIIPGKVVVDDAVSLGNGPLCRDFLFFRHNNHLHRSFPRILALMPFKQPLRARFKDRLIAKLSKMR